MKPWESETEHHEVDPRIVMADSAKYRSNGFAIFDSILLLFWIWKSKKF